jgi:hypothetical protein
VLIACQVCDRARQLEDAVERVGAYPRLLHRGLDQTPAFFV